MNIILVKFKAEVIDMERAIVHSDINHCYAQIEEMLNPELKKQPMAVGGSQEERHGIILAKRFTDNIRIGLKNMDWMKPGWI